MGTIAYALQKISAIDLNKTVEYCIQQTADDILTLNKAQLKQGLLNTGASLTPKYSSPIYAIDKERQNPAPGLFNPDLYVTGAFYSGFTIAVQSGSFTIGSTDSKAPDLESKYSSNIYGLNQQSKEKYIPILYPKIIAGIKAESGL